MLRSATTLVAAFALVAFAAVPCLYAQDLPVPTPAQPGAQLSAPAAAPAAPSALEFPKMTIDLGDIDEGTSPEIVFPVKNISDKVINITDVKTSCGCTAKNDNNPTKLMPGEESTFRVTFSSEGRRGHQSKTVAVHTDEGPNAVYNLAFSTNVISSLFLEPATVEFGVVEQGASATRQFSVISLVEGGIKITGVDSSDPALKITLAETADTEQNGRKGTKYTFDVVVPEDYPQPNIVARATVKTEGNQYIQPVIIRGRVVGDVTFVPNRAFGVVQAGESTSKTLVLSSRSGAKIDIIEAKLEDADLPMDVVVEDGTKPSEKLVIATFRGEGQPQTRQSKINVRFKTSAKEAESTMELPVIYVQRPTATSAPAAAAGQPGGRPLSGTGPIQVGPAQPEKPSGGQ